MRSFLIAEPADTTLRALSDALNCMDVGIILLNADMRVRFVNDRQIELFNLPPSLLAAGPSFRDLVVFAASNGWFAAPPEELGAFVANRVKSVQAGPIETTRIDLANGVSVLFSCRTCRDGGRILAYADISRELKRQAQATMAQISAEVLFKTEMLEDQGAYLANLAEAADESTQKAEMARLELENEIAERRHLETELRRLATTDSLTGILNRPAFLAAGQEAIERVRPVDQTVAILMLDVDHFKSINDHYGHAGGDLALQNLAETLRSGLRENDLLGRLGGEEFAIVLHAGSPEIAEAIAERLRNRVEADRLQFDSRVIEMTISIGLAILQPADNSIEQLIAQADSALYHAKRGGRNQVVKSPPSVAA